MSGRADYFIVQGGTVRAFFDASGAKTIVADVRSGPLACVRTIESKSVSSARAPKNAAIAIDLDQRAALVADEPKVDETEQQRLRAIWEREGFFLGWAPKSDIAAFAKLRADSEEDDEEDDDEEEPAPMPEVKRVAFAFSLSELGLGPLFASLLDIPPSLMSCGCWITWHQHDDFNRVLEKFPESPLDAEVSDATMSAVEFVAHHETMARTFAPELWDTPESITVQFAFGFHPDLDVGRVVASLVDDGFTVMRYSDWLARSPDETATGDGWSGLSTAAWRWSKDDEALLDRLVKEGRFDREAAAAWLANTPTVDIATDRHGLLRAALSRRGASARALDELACTYSAGGMCRSQLLFVARMPIDELVAGVDRVHPKTSEADASLYSIRTDIEALELPHMVQKWQSALEASKHGERFAKRKVKRAKKK